MSILKVFLAICITVVLVFFALSNMHVTEVSFIFGPPVQIRTIVLILGTFLFGILTVLFFYTVRRLRLGAGASRHPPQIELPEDFDDID